MKTSKISLAVLTVRVGAIAPVTAKAVESCLYRARQQLRTSLSRWLALT